MNTTPNTSQSIEDNHENTVHTIEAFLKHKAFRNAIQTDNLSESLFAQIAENFETTLDYEYSKDFDVIECFQAISNLIQNEPNFIIDDHPIILNFLYSSEIWRAKSDEMSLRNCEDIFSVSQKEIDDFLSILNAIIKNNKGAMFDRSYASYDQLLKTKQKWKTIQQSTYNALGTTEVQQFKNPIELCVKFFSEKIQTV